MGQEQLPLHIADSANYKQLSQHDGSPLTQLDPNTLTQHDADPLTQHDIDLLSQHDLSETRQDKSLLYIDDSATYDLQSQLDSQEELQLVQKYFDSPGYPEEWAECDPDGSVSSGSDLDQDVRPPRRMHYFQNVIHRVPPWVMQHR